MNRQWKQTVVMIGVLALGAAGARANNLSITNVTVSGRDNSTATVAPGKTVDAFCLPN